MKSLKSLIFGIPLIFAIGCSSVPYVSTGIGMFSLDTENKYRTMLKKESSIGLVNGYSRLGFNLNQINKEVDEEKFNLNQIEISGNGVLPLGNINIRAGIGCGYVIIKERIKVPKKEEKKGGIIIDFGNLIPVPTPPWLVEDEDETYPKGMKGDNVNYSFEDKVTNSFSYTINFGVDIKIKKNLEFCVDFEKTYWKDKEENRGGTSWNLGGRIKW